MKNHSRVLCKIMIWSDLPSKNNTLEVGKKSRCGTDTEHSYRLMKLIILSLVILSTDTEFENMKNVYAPQPQEQKASYSINLLLSKYPHHIDFHGFYSPGHANVLLGISLCPDPSQILLIQDQHPWSILTSSWGHWEAEWSQYLANCMSLEIFFMVFCAQGCLSVFAGFLCPPLKDTWVFNQCAWLATVFPEQALAALKARNSRRN